MFQASTIMTIVGVRNLQTRWYVIQSFQYAAGLNRRGRAWTSFWVGPHLATNPFPQAGSCGGESTSKEVPTRGGPTVALLHVAPWRLDRVVSIDVLVTLLSHAGARWAGGAGATWAGGGGATWAGGQVAVAPRGQVGRWRWRHVALAPRGQVGRWRWRHVALAPRGAGARWRQVGRWRWDVSAGIHPG